MLGHLLFKLEFLEVQGFVVRCNLGKQEVTLRHSVKGGEGEGDQA